MIRLSLIEIAEVLQGQLYGNGSVNIHSVSIDSRDISNDTLFIAIKGARFDGHEFAEKAVENGVVALIVEKLLDINIPQIVVENSHRSLGQLGNLVRKKVDPFCIALTGSNGKTSVKEMVATILSQNYNVLFTEGNFNNDIGVPLTLLRLTTETEFGVFELGANHHQEIYYTSSLVQPDIALVNNVGSAHLEGFGSREGIAKAKSEIFDFLSATGTAIINADDDFVQVMKDAAKNNAQICFGINGTADVRATNLQCDELGCYRFLITTHEQSQRVTLPLTGRHQVMNALAATSICLAAGMKLPQIVDGLLKLTPVRGRMLPIRLGRLLLVDDTYNANPSSVKVAIEWLKNINNTRFLVLGDLLELGENTEKLHAEIGEFAKNSQIDGLFCLGKLSHFISNAFGCGHFDDLSLLMSHLIKQINGTKGQITILVKGSRSSAMERIIDALQVAYQRGEIL